MGIVITSNMFCYKLGLRRLCILKLMGLLCESCFGDVSTVSRVVVKLYELLSPLIQRGVMRSPHVETKPNGAAVDQIIQLL